MLRLNEDFTEILKDNYLLSLNKKLKKILLQTNWGKTKDNEFKRLKLENVVLLDLFDNITESNGKKKENEIKLLKSTIEKISLGYIMYEKSDNQKIISEGKKLGIKLKEIWNLLEPHIGSTRKKFIGLWTIYGIGLNNDFDIINNRYLSKIIASNSLKIYYAIIVDDLADNITLKNPYRNNINELLFTKNIILPRIFSNKKSYTRKQLVQTLKSHDINPQRIDFIMAVCEVITAFYELDSSLPYFNEVKNKMLKELKMHIDDCITTYKFNANPSRVSFKKYLLTAPRGMLMLSFLYTQIAGRRKQIKINDKEKIVENMQKTQKIFNDIGTWQREYDEKCYYNGIIIRSLEKKYINLTDLKKHNLRKEQLQKIESDVVQKLPSTAARFLKKIKNISPKDYNNSIQRVLWVSKIQQAFRGEV